MSFQILHSGKDQQMHITNRRWRTAAIVKSVISATVRPVAMEFGLMTLIDPQWRPLKFRTFKHPRWQTSAILKRNEKIAYFRKNSTNRHKAFLSEAFTIL